MRGQPPERHGERRIKTESFCEMQLVMVLLFQAASPFENSMKPEL